MTSADASKEYDGTPLTSNEITVGGEDGFVEGEGVTYTVTGAQTEVGSVIIALLTLPMIKRTLKRTMRLQRQKVH